MTSRKWIFASVLFSVSVAQAEAMYGMFMVVKGDVKVTNAQNQTNAVKVGSKIHPGETVISGADSRAKIVMADRNVINVLPATTLKIEKYENDSKTGIKNAEINLVDGKARSNVEQKYDGEKSKFLIKTPTAVAGVRGTQFMMSYNRQTQVSQVVTLQGSVTFAPATAQGIGQAVEVKKGEMTSLAAGAAAPEPPKALPKEELKQLDKESTGSAAPKKEETAKTAENGQPGGEAKSDREPASEPMAPTAPLDVPDDPVVTDDPKRPEPPPVPKVHEQPRNDTINDMIKNKFDKTKVIIVPK